MRRRCGASYAAPFARGRGVTTHAATECRGLYHHATATPACVLGRHARRACAGVYSGAVYLQGRTSGSSGLKPRKVGISPGVLV